MVLAPSRRNSTCQLANADEDREIADPDQCEAIDQTGRPATETIRRVQQSIQTIQTHFWNPMAKILVEVRVSNCRKETGLTPASFPTYT
jgi:hypothetical protein